MFLFVSATDVDRKSNEKRFHTEGLIISTFSLPLPPTTFFCQLSFERKSKAEQLFSVTYCLLIYHLKGTVQWLGTISGKQTNKLHMKKLRLAKLLY